MPVKTAKRAVKTTCQQIRDHWTKAEAVRRRETAELMQQRLVDALGLRRMPAR